MHLFAQDDWRVRDGLTMNFGLRYELNQHMRDVDNRLSTIDLSVPGGRYVIASDDAGNISPAAEELLPAHPDSLGLVGGGGVGPEPAPAEQVAARAALRSCLAAG